jgi:hypothetical protein
MNDREKKLVKHIGSPLAIFITILVIVGLSRAYGQTSGTPRWVVYTGILTEFDIDCSQCCHPSSYFRMNTTNGIISELIGDCDLDLEHLVTIGHVYTIRIEPYAEPYAATHAWGEPGAFWAVQIDWIKDYSGRVIYGNEYW